MAATCRLSRASCCSRCHSCRRAAASALLPGGGGPMPCGRLGPPGGGGPAQPRPPRGRPSMPGGKGPGPGPRTPAAASPPPPPLRCLAPPRDRLHRQSGSRGGSTMVCTDRAQWTLQIQQTAACAAWRKAGVSVTQLTFYAPAASRQQLQLGGRCRAAATAWRRRRRRPAAVPAGALRALQVQEAQALCL